MVMLISPAGLWAPVSVVLGPEYAQDCQGLQAGCPEPGDRAEGSIYAG
jgi:hypothetical protein